MFVAELKSPDAGAEAARAVTGEVRRGAAPSLKTACADGRRWTAVQALARRLDGARRVDWGR